MEFNKLVFAALSVGCLTAAAGGSYLAVRQNQSASAIVESSDLRPAPRRTGAKSAVRGHRIRRGDCPRGAEARGRASSDSVRAGAPCAVDCGSAECAACRARRSTFFDKSFDSRYFPGYGRYRSLRTDVRVAGTISGSQHVWNNVGDATQRCAVDAGI